MTTTEIILLIIFLFLFIIVLPITMVVITYKWFIAPNGPAAEMNFYQSATKWRLRQFIVKIFEVVALFLPMWTVVGVSLFIPVAGIFVVTILVTRNIGLSVSLPLMGYVLIGGIVTLLKGGIFCDKIAQEHRNRLNYMWAIPVDSIITPMSYLIWVAWGVCFGF